MKWVDNFKVKFAIFMFKVVQRLILFNNKMMQWKANSKEYLKNPTADGFHPNK